MGDQPAGPDIPVRMRLGDGDEYEVGTISDPAELPDFFRDLAAEADRQRADTSE
jgi:hypothetical protein